MSAYGTHLDLDGDATYSQSSISFSCHLGGTADLTGADEAEVHVDAACTGDAGDTSYDCTYAGPSQRCSGFASDDCFE